jgi:hypothetical protein
MILPFLLDSDKVLMSLPFGCRFPRWASRFVGAREFPYLLLQFVFSATQAASIYLPPLPHVSAVTATNAPATGFVVFTLFGSSFGTLHF